MTNDIDRALRGIVLRVWLAVAAAAATCAVLFQTPRGPFVPVVAAAFVFAAGIVAVAGWAARRAGPFAVVLTAAVAAGALPALLTVGLYAGSRPLLACYNVHCGATVATAMGVGAVTTLVPLAVATGAAFGIARLRGRGMGLYAALGILSLVLSATVAVIGATNVISLTSTDAYVESLPVVGTVRGATFAVGVDDISLHQPEPKEPQLFGARWSWRLSGMSCDLSIAGGGYELAAAGVVSTKHGAATVTCPDVRVRKDERRGIVIIDEPTSDGGFRPAFSVNTRTGVSGPLYPDGYTFKGSIGPPRAFAFLGGFAVLCAFSFVAARIVRERRLSARWRAARIGTHRGDGWVAFDDDAPPVHLPSAVDLPAGDVRVLGGKTNADGRSRGYRSSDAAVATDLVAGDVDVIEQEGRNHAAAAVAIWALVAAIGTTPLLATTLILASR